MSGFIFYLVITGCKVVRVLGGGGAQLQLDDQGCVLKQGGVLDVRIWFMVLDICVKALVSDGHVC